MPIQQIFVSLEMSNRNKIIAGALLLLVIILGGVMLNRQTKLKEENKQLTMEVDSLQKEKVKLLAEIDGLSTAFEMEKDRADSLSTLLTSAQEEISRRNAAAQKIKKQHTTDMAVLKQEIEQLKLLKSESTSIIAQLRKENEALLAQNVSLNQTVQQVQAENSQLSEKGRALSVSNKELETSVAKLKAASVKASDFQVTVNKKSGKTTAAAGKAKSISVSFDMNNVPAEHRVRQTIYLVISDDKGTPMKVANPIHARLTVDGKPVEIEAQQEKKIKLGANQQIEFEQSFDERIKAGNYKVSIFSEMGLLGSSKFTLS